MKYFQGRSISHHGFPKCHRSCANPFIYHHYRSMRDQFGIAVTNHPVISPSILQSWDLSLSQEKTSTYDHRVWKTGLPVRSAVLKPHAGRLVVGWVTTSESLLLYVFLFIFISSALSHHLKHLLNRMEALGWIVVRPTHPRIWPTTMEKTARLRPYASPDQTKEIRFPKSLQQYIWSIALAHEE